MPYAEVIGDPVGHSLSPVIHRFWLAKLGIDGDYRATKVSVADLSLFLTERRGDSAWRGCNVTMPLKQAVLPLLDVVEDDGVGAVNCIVPTSAGLVGRNSDVDGVLEAVRSGNQCPCELHVATLIDLIGTGGAARAVLAALRGSEITVIGRDKAKADALSDEFGPGSGVGFSAQLASLMDAPFIYDPAYPDVKPNLGVTQRYDYVVINATSLGMSGQPALLIRLDRYPPNTVVIDLVYNPLETPLLQEARRLGMVTVDGLVMLIGQAAAAFAMFFGHPAPRQYDAELRALLTA